MRDNRKARQGFNADVSSFGWFSRYDVNNELSTLTEVYRGR